MGAGLRSSSIVRPSRLNGLDKKVFILEYLFDKAVQECLGFELQLLSFLLVRVVKKDCSSFCLTSIHHADVGIQVNQRIKILKEIIGKNVKY